MSLQNDAPSFSFQTCPILLLKSLADCLAMRITLLSPSKSSRDFLLGGIRHLSCLTLVVLVLFHIIYFIYKYLQSLKSMVRRYGNIEIFYENFWKTQL